VDGPSIVARTLSTPGKPDRFGNRWQYHSRSDRHSKIACWCVLFEVLQHSSVLRRHVEEQKVIFGVNQELRDYQTNRSKVLDLVIATAGGEYLGPEITLADLAERWAIDLTAQQRTTLEGLPRILLGNTGIVLMALEAKATMTAHIKALPRLFDELNSSHLTVHANTNRALSAAFALVNVSPTFVSSDINKFDMSQLPPIVSTHRQPHWAERTIEKLRDIPRRTSLEGAGFDAFGIVVVDMANDGSPVTVSPAPPAPRPGDVDHYDQMIYRLVHGYDTAFHAI
jgi:hypothetical protein